MDRKQVAAILEEMAVLLELTGANPFKSRAYANGARVVGTLDEDLGKLVSEGRLGEIRGVGKGIAGAITELVETGSFRDHDELKKKIPPGLLEILGIPGLGPKKVRLLWQEVGITGVDELEAAARAGKLGDLTGFGGKTERNILRGIEQRRRYAGRALWIDARRIAARFEEVLAGHPRVRRHAVAGSLRRSLETVHDADLLASVDEQDRDAVMDAFVGAAPVTRIVARGPTKSSVVAEDGLQVDLRCVSDEEFPFALHHFTGSRAHNTALRARAKKLGLKMSEWGVFRGSTKLAARDEEDVFALLGLPWIPPELREDRGEIEAAEAEELPELVAGKDLKGILHAHTTASDGRDSLEVMVRATRERGYSYLGVSDHSQAAFYANGLDAARLREQHREIESLRRKIRGFTIFHGIESDILEDGSLDYDDEVLAELDFVIASVHSLFTMSRERMTERILTAIRHPAVNILAHPTGRLLLAREPYEVDLDRVLAEAGRLGVAVELNANPHRLDLDWRRCRGAVRGGVVVAIGPDAHGTDGLDDVLHGLGIARKGWLTPGNILNCRTASRVREFFRARRRDWTPRPGKRSRYGERGDLLP